MFYVYILASAYHGYLYIGLTSNLPKRVWEHKNKVYKNSYTSQHNIYNLVYYEAIEDAHAAIRREKLLKKLSREKKFHLIENTNKSWSDLSFTLTV